MDRRLYSFTRGNAYQLPREWTMGELEKAKEDLKIGAKVEVRTGDGTGFGLIGKLFRGTVLEKYDKYFIVHLKTKNGSGWDECFSYIDLMNEKKVRVLRK